MQRLLLAMSITVALTALLAPASAPAQGILYLHEPGETIVPDGDAERLAVIPPPGIWPPPPPMPPPRPPRPPRPRPLAQAELTSLELDIEIVAPTARTRLDQTFHNPNDRQMEGTYFFPLPRNAAVSDMSLYIDGQPVKAEVLEADKARGIYEDIVRAARDPALLEYVGQDLVCLRIFPIEARQTRRVRFEYVQALASDFGLTEYVFPLAGQDQRERPLKQMILTGSIHAPAPIATVYSPTHDIDFVRRDERNIRFSLEAADKRPAGQLRILFGVSEKELGASLITWRRAGEDGYFLLMIAPRPDTDRQERRIARDVTFVFDTSGSMAGEKIVQARNALRYCLQALREEDRFNVLRFSTDVESHRPAPVPATRDNVEEALQFVEGFQARGGTAIEAALTEAFKGRQDPDRPHMIVFMTDGQPTVGERDMDTLTAMVGDRYGDTRRRLFSFGVGHDVNTRLIDNLSEEAGAVSYYVSPEEDLEVKVSAFFAKVSDPILTDLEIEFGDAQIAQWYPQRLPDLFAGSQLTLLGRYRGAGRQTVVLSGQRGDENEVYEYSLDFPAESQVGDYLPRLWAIRRVGHLVAEIRRHGESDELRDEIIRLGRQYAIATPYTSLLTVEDEAVPRREVTAAPMGPRPAPGVWMDRPADTRRRFDAAMPSDGFSTGGWGMGAESAGPVTAPGRAAQPSGAAGGGAPQVLAETGAAGLTMAMRTREMRERERIDDSDGTTSDPSTRIVLGRVFRQNADGVWIESAYDGERETVKIHWGSDAYFALLTNDAEAAGPILALGAQVIFAHQDRWIEIIEAEMDEGEN